MSTASNADPATLEVRINIPEGRSPFADQLAPYKPAVFEPMSIKGKVATDLPESPYKRILLIFESDHDEPPIKAA